MSGATRAGARFALPVSIGAAMVSVAAAGFAAGYELVAVAAERPGASGRRRRAPHRSPAGGSGRSARAGLGGRSARGGLGGRVMDRHPS